MSSKARTAFKRRFCHKRKGYAKKHHHPIRLSHVKQWMLNNRWTNLARPIVRPRYL